LLNHGKGVTFCEEKTMTRALKFYQGIFGRVSLVESDRDLVTHAHPQCHVLIKVGGADSSYQLGGKTHTLNEDNIILANAWEPHSKIHRAADGRSLVLALFIEPQWLSSIFPGLSASGLPGCFPAPCAVLPAHIRRLADRLVSQTCEADSGWRAHAHWEAALLELMMAIIHAFSVKPDRTGAFHRGARRMTDPRIARAIHFMENHLGESFTSEQLARMHCLSRPHFFSLFKECTALSPALYMNTLRMEAALSGLAHDSVSIGTLSDSLGFSEPHHFTRFFRHNLGIPPTEYRRTVTIVQQARGASMPRLISLKPNLSGSDIAFGRRAAVPSAIFSHETALS
jgi:AraC family transcriptional regulator